VSNHSHSALIPDAQGRYLPASVYLREVVKEALRLNAAAVILSHNYPSGNPEPSSADKMLTQRLKDALALVEVRTLDTSSWRETSPCPSPNAT